jgi:hypothetical protein
MRDSITRRKYRRRERRKERMKYKALSIILALLLLASIAPMIHLAHAATTSISAINPGPASKPAKWTAGPDVADQGTNNFHFTTTDTTSGSYFFVNVTITTTGQLKAWGFGLIFDNTTVQYVSAWRPTDHVFSVIEAGGTSMVAPAVVFADVDATHQEIQWGCSYIMPSPAAWFTGTGQLAQVQFKIIASVSQLNPIVTSTFAYDAAWTGDYYYPSGSDVPDMVSPAANFKYEWLAPTTFPDFFVKPPAQTALKIGDDVPFEVWVTNVDPGWGIIGFQFELWYNTSLLNGTTSYSVGPWMSTFATVGNNESVLAQAFNDYLGVDPELPLNYNKWAAVIILVPGTGGYSAPFPGAGSPYGGSTGMLFTFHMQAVEQTIFPAVDTTLLTLNHMLVYNDLGQKIAISTPTNATYTAPQKTLGLSIDLYSCRDGVLQDNGLWIIPKYQGMGQNVPTDMYQPQAEVDLQANLTYNGWPVQQKLTGFQIVSPTGVYMIYRENYTDFWGTAWIKFRIPWPCLDPWNSTFGVWNVTVTVEVAKQIVNDTMQFKVGWPVQVLNVTGQDVNISKTNPTPMKFTVWYSTQRMDLSDIPLLLTVAAYDNLGFFIGGASKTKMLSAETMYFANGTVIPQGDLVWCTTAYFKETFDITTPTNAVVGPATVYADAFNLAPWYGGVPWSPEAVGYFNINIP